MVNENTRNIIAELSLVIDKAKEAVEALKSVTGEVSDIAEERDLIITITGPSLSGKTTLAKELQRTGPFMELVSHTTRPKRAGEKEGEAYYFVTEAEFHRLSFIETTYFAGNHYGLSVDEFLRVRATGNVPIVVVDPNGANQIFDWSIKNDCAMVSVYMDPGVAVRADRMVKRIYAEDPAKMNSQAIAKRMVSMFTEESDWHLLREWHLQLFQIDLETNRDEVVHYLKKRGWLPESFRVAA